MSKQTKKTSKEPMKIRPLDEMDINLRTKDLLSRALERYNSGSIKYERPQTLGMPKSRTMAMDECIKCTDGIINVFAPEWQALTAPKFLGYAILSSLAQDPLIRAGIETIADDMTRKFIELTSQGDKDLSDKLKELEDDLNHFRIKSLFNRALSLTGYQGGCLVYIDVGPLDDEERVTPLYLDPTTFRKGSLRGFKIIEPINVYPGVYNASDPTADDYFNPETWYILGKEYHKSRFLYFAQNEVPLLLKPLYNFFGISLSQQVLEYVQNFTENRRSAQRLLNKFSLTVWKTDMSAFLSGGDCNSLTQRVKYFNAQRNNDGTALIDKELEEMVQINTPLAGVTDIVSMSLDLAPVILGISKDKYFGDLPKGLNASSEGTNRIYYDKIQSLNEKISFDAIAKVLKILQLNRYGEIDNNVSFRFAPLWEMDERERAEINKIHADTAAVYVDRGCLSQEEVRGALADNPDSGYSNIDVDDVPETDNFADVDLEDKDEAGSVFDEEIIIDKWDESKHPRAENGQFGNSSRSSVSEIVLSGTELGGNNLEPSVLRNKAKEYYKRNLAGTKVKNPQLGEIEFSSKGFKKPVSFSADIRKLQLFPALKDIIAKGKLIEEETERYGRTNVTSFYTLRSSVKLGDKKINVRVSIRKDNSGKLYYDHVITKPTETGSDGIEEKVNLVIE